MTARMPSALAIAHVQRTGAAEGDEREFAGRHRARRSQRARLVAASPRRRRRRRPSAGNAGPLSAAARPRGRRAGRDRERRLGRDATEHKVGVGDRWLSPTEPVTRGTRQRARACGPTTNAPPASTRDRTAAGADRVHVEGRERIGRPATVRARRLRCRLCTRHTSVLVPPMSKLTTSANPHAAAISAAGAHAAGRTREQQRGGRHARRRRPGTTRRPRSSPELSRPARACVRDTELTMGRR